MLITDDKKFMQLAIDKAKVGISQGQTPFGSCIVQEGKVIGLAHNTVWKDSDITQHAEMHAIRAACRKLRRVDISGAVIYSTCEPCPMCFSAIHWAGISRIVYGARISDAKKAGFRELAIPVRKMAAMGGCRISIAAGFMRKENLALFCIWKKRRDRKAY